MWTKLHELLANVNDGIVHREMKKGNKFIIFCYLFWIYTYISTNEKTRSYKNKINKYFGHYSLHATIWNIVMHSNGFSCNSRDSNSFIETKLLAIVFAQKTLSSKKRRWREFINSRNFRWFEYLSRRENSTVAVVL